MTPARMRRLYSDYEEVKRHFADNQNIIVRPVGGEPPEQYHVTYFVNGIYLLPDGRIETLGRHEVDITLHADYPRYKPICKITTPIWHPNFRDGQICIGDIWGAGESLSDIIVNIADMIQYKSWNSYSPLSADAAKWAMENKHLFPVGNVDIVYADRVPEKETIEIDFSDEPTPEQEGRLSELVSEPAPEKAPEPVLPVRAQQEPEDENDFEITAEELAGIQFVPTAQRMQTVSHNSGAKAKVNFKTILQKGILWALIGALIGFALTELFSGAFNNSKAAAILGYTHLAEYLKLNEKADAEWDTAYDEYEQYCKRKGLDPADEGTFVTWLNGDISESAKRHLDNYRSFDADAKDALYDAYVYDFGSDDTAMENGIKKTVRVSTGMWSAVLALFIGLSLGVGEGIFYGSKEKALQYGAIGAAISVVLGFFSGDLAQYLYASLLGDDPSLFMSSLTRGAGWAVMGLGIGLAVGLIRPEKKRILFCSLGGIVGAFLGGFLFNYVCELIPNEILARAVALVLMGLLIGIGVGLLEQFAKQAWLKVIRGEFEGKEYLVFAGTTSIGNNGKNTIVLFKDKLVGPHHCDIVLEGSKYVLVDCGTPMGTVVNGMKTARHVLRQGDAIAIGNSVLVFNTK